MRGLAIRVVVSSFSSVDLLPDQSEYDNTVVRTVTVVSLPVTHKLSNLGAVEPVVNLGGELLGLSEHSSAANGLVESLGVNASKTALEAGVYRVEKCNYVSKMRL